MKVDGSVEGWNSGTVTSKGPGRVEGRNAGTFTSNAGRFSVHAERSLDLGFKWNLTTILNEGSRI